MPRQKPTHSKGPWTVSFGDKRSLFVMGGEPKKVIAEVLIPASGDPSCDARLIQAAPLLLEACLAAIKAIGAGINSDPELWRDAQLKLESSIAKATGGE